MRGWPSFIVGLLLTFPAFGQAPPAPADTASQEEREKLYQQIFGNRNRQQPPPRERQVQLPVVLDEREIAQVPAILPVDMSTARLEAAPLLAALKPVLAAPILAKIDAQKDQRGFVTPEALKAAGLEATLDVANLSLALRIPIDLRLVQTIGLRERAPRVSAEGIVPPATVSSFLNLRSGIDYVHDGAAGTGLGRQPMNIAFESGTNLKGYVFQADLNYFEGDRKSWQRGDMSLVHDDVANSVRYQLGDLSYPVAGFQSFIPMGGFTVARNFSLQPYKVVQPSGQQTLSLVSPSRVEVLVNGQTTQVIRLAPGNYNLRDFPFTQGANDVQLRVTDSVGRVSIVNLPFFFSNDLLAAGTSEFAYSVGEPVSIVSGTHQYARHVPALTLFHRYGITDNLTIGANLQGDNRQQMSGLEIETSNVLGSFRLDLAGSRGPSFRPDFAARLQYAFADARTLDSDSRNFFASIAYNGSEFAPLGVTSPNNPVKFDLAARYFQQLPFNFTGGIGASYQFQRDRPNSSGIDLSLRRWLTRTVSASLDLSRNVDTTGRQEYRALFNFFFQFTEQRQFAQTSYDSRNNTIQAQWQYIPETDVGAPSANLSTTNSDGQTLLSGGATYNSSRFETSLSHDEAYPHGGTGSIDRRSSLRFGSSLVFADGHFGIGRPIDDSFALVVAHPNLRSSTVGVDPVDEQNYRARVDWLGPAVLSNLSSYQIRSLRVTVPDLPLGLELGQDVFELQPTFRSGAVLKVGNDAVVLLDGVLVDKNGKPLPLQAGEAREVGAATGKAQQFFTNRTGRFRIDGMHPGQYDVTLNADTRVTVRITVPDNATGIYRLGDLKIPIEIQP